MNKLFQLDKWTTIWRTIFRADILYPAPSSRNVIWLVIAIVITLFWQRTFEYASSRLDLTYRVTVASGLSGQDRFYYFFHYLGLYPLYAEGIEPVYDNAGASSIIREHPASLRMEAGYLFRAGDPGKIWLYTLGAWLKGTADNLSTLEFNSWFFTLGLIGILVAMWYAHHFLLGVLMVALIGSHPFQLYEIYADNLNRGGQVFSVNISSALWLLAFYIPLIFNRRLPQAYIWILAIATGIFFGTLRQIRSEPTALIVSTLACYALISHMSWRTRLTQCLLLLAAFSITSSGWDSYWSAKFDKTYRVVQLAGGQPYDGGYYRYHPLWHTLWCGLGDFGKKYGYSWDDVAAYDYATPIMKQEGSINYEMIGTERSTAWYDSRQLYYKMIWTEPRYQEILRDKILLDIWRDPLWYVEVIARRTWRILTEVVPIRISAGSQSVDLPFSGLWLIPTIVALVWLRQWSLTILVGFTLPLATTALVVYSGSGFTYYSIFPQMLVAIYGMVLMKLAQRAWQVVRASRAKASQE